jgi:5'-nucleotidase (lipoprotein e(P4) family)
MRSNARSLAILWTFAVIAMLGAGCACSRAVSKPDATTIPGNAPDTASPPVRHCGHERLNAVLWAQTAVEHEFACRQSFLLAQAKLDEALADPTWTAALEQTSGYETLPPAVIVDADETMLDNSPCEARFIVKNMDFDPKMWGAWVDEARAAEIPGAREFMQHASARGVRVFFVTNRGERSEAATVKNLKAVFGQDITPEDVLCKYEQEDWTSNKSSRRAYLASTHRILLLIGDDFNDFTYLGDVPAADRLTRGERYWSFWGTRWVILPNAMYGSWEEALYGYETGLPDSTRLNRKYDALTTAQ